MRGKELLSPKQAPQVHFHGQNPKNPSCNFKGWLQHKSLFRCLMTPITPYSIHATRNTLFPCQTWKQVRWMLVQEPKHMCTISFTCFEVTMLDIAISVSSTCCHPCTWEFIIKKLIYRHYLLHQNVVVTLECGLHIIFTFHLPNPIFSLQALPPTSFTTFLTHGWTSVRTPSGNIAIPLRKIEVINLKGPHVMPG